MKVLIIGNIGCGKTYIGKQLSKKLNLKLYHIDDICFKPGGYTNEHKRTSSERKEIIKDIMQNKSYIIEGASGLTAKQFANVCTHLVFLNYPKMICLNSIKTRTLESGQVSSKKQTNDLYNYAKTYYLPTNTGSISRHTHEQIASNFKYNKYIIYDRESASRLTI